MTKHPVTWFILADGGRARFLKRRSEGPGYDIIEEIAAEEANLPSHDLGSDRPGRTHESSGSAHHAIEPRQDPHRARKASFTHHVADRLNEASERGAFDALMVYAAPRSLAELRTALSPATQKKVKAEVPKDLTKLPLAELAEHFEANR